MIRVLLIVAALVLPVLGQQAEEAKAWPIIPGKRVGPITALSSLSTLQALFGWKNVKMCKLPGAEGETIDGARINAGPGRELEIVWEDGTVGRRIADVRLTGKAWTLDNGLRLGSTVPEVEAVNGRPFKLSGFGWDYGGWATFEGGGLGAGLAIRFLPSEEHYSTEITGDRSVSSDSSTLRAAHPLVTELVIHLGS